MNEKSWTGSLPSISVASRPSPSREKRSERQTASHKKGETLLWHFFPQGEGVTLISQLSQDAVKSGSVWPYPGLRTDAASAMLWITNVPFLGPPGLTLLILLRITHLGLTWTWPVPSLLFSSTLLTWLHPYSSGVKAVPLRHYIYLHLFPLHVCLIWQPRLMYSNCFQRCI